MTPKENEQPKEMDTPGESTDMVEAPQASGPIGVVPIKSAPKIKAKYRAAIHTGPEETVPAEFVDAVQALEKELKMPVWLLIQNDESPYGQLGREVYEGFYEARRQLRDTKVALLLDSPGGFARQAFQIAKLLRGRESGFSAVIPKFAKSAATLLALGAETIILADDAELGPLDAQIFDFERESRCSALDEVQALERLHAEALEAVDRTMLLLMRQSGKKLETILPTAMRFVADLMKPLLDKIDTVHYSQMQRALKEAEDYASILLVQKYGPDLAKRIARHLVGHYAEHGFVIDRHEAASFGLHTVAPSVSQEPIIEALIPFMDTLTAIGPLEEIKS